MFKKSDKVLITGGSGTIGSYFDFGLRPSSEELDIRDKKNVSDFISNNKPGVVIHLAAITDLKFCEDNPKIAEETNVKGTENLAEASEKTGALFVYLSSNAVFDGCKKTPYLEDDQTNPINHYGWTKLKSEKIVMGICKNWLIVRTCWVFGGKDKDKRFVDKIINQLGNKEIRVASDNIGSPTYAKDLVENINTLIAKNKRGIFHISNDGLATRFEEAKFITDYSNWHGKLIPVPVESFNSGYKFPKNESLASKFIKLRTWQKALREYLDKNFKNGRG